MLRVVSPLSDREEQVFSRAMDCAFAVHRELGPGYREMIYAAAFCLELDLKGIGFEREKKIDVRYKRLDYRRVVLPEGRSWEPSQCEGGCR